MTQLDLLSREPRRAKKRVRVPRTSVQAYQAAPRDARIAAVVQWLGEHLDYMPQEPTSAELARYRWRDTHQLGRVSLECLLSVRRGLSDALARGLVEHGPARTCQVTGRRCVTWRFGTR